MLTKNAVGNLINRYRSVLANCRLLNAFGTLALATALSTGLLTATDAKAVSESVLITVPDTEATWTTDYYRTLESYGINLGMKKTGVYAQQGLGTSDPTEVAITVRHNLSFWVRSEQLQATSIGIAASRNTNFLNNIGATINVEAVGGTDAMAYGMQAMGDEISLINETNAIITVEATSKDQSKAYGMQALGSSTTTTTASENYGEIYATATSKSTDSATADAYGMWAMSGGKSFTNSRMIDVEATAESTSTSATAKAHGMWANRDTNKLSNSDAITVKAIANAESNAEATAEAHGMFAFSGEHTLTNETNAIITVEAMSTSGDATAYGMRAKGTTRNELNNYGIIDVIPSDATGTGINFAYGMYAEGDDDATNIIINGTNGVITVRGKSTAYGMRANKGSNSFTNSGMIDVEATSKDQSKAYGMDANGIANTLTNKANGIISVTAISGINAFAWGMYGTNRTSELTNEAGGKITVTAIDDSNAYACGMETFAPDNATLTNSGDITVTAEVTAGYSSARAVGMMPYLMGMGPSTLINKEGGTITVKATSINAIARGMCSLEASSNSFTNRGGITVEAVGDGEVEASGMNIVHGENTLTNSGKIDVTATSKGDAIVTAYGMYTYGDRDDLTNEAGGIITVKAKSTNGDAKAYGMYVAGARDKLTNGAGGIITVTAESTNGDATAYGMYVADGTSILNNYGTIAPSATGKSAKTFQAYVGGGTGNVGTWTVELKKTGAYCPNYVFGVGGARSKLIFGLTKDDKGNDITNDGATLIIANGKADFEEMYLYPVRDLVEIEDSATPENVEGYIGKVEPITDYAFLDWLILNEDRTLYDLTRIDRTWEDQYISGVLNPTEETSPTHPATQLIVSGINTNLHHISNILALETRKAGDGLRGSKLDMPQGDDVPQGDGAAYMVPIDDLEIPVWKIFAVPYYGQTGANDNSYDTNMYGLVMGATRDITDDLSLGMHIAFSKGEGDSSMSNTDTTAYTLGAHAVYNMGEHLFFRGQLSGFMSENELDILSTTATDLLRANTDMDTSGLYAMLTAGYDIPLAFNAQGAPEHILTPELALSYFYAHMDGFDTHFYNAGVQDAAFGMESESYDAFYADATVRWTGAFAFGESMLKPTLKAGVRQTLSDPEITSTLKFGNATATTYSDANNTAFLCETGLAWEVDDLTLSATYRGEFGDVEYSHMGMFKVEWEF